MVRVSRADLYLKVGLGLDRWSDAIIDGSHNGNVHIIDCSKGVEVLEKPTGKVDASMGDIHPDGNPHYWLDPKNATIVAQTIASALSQVDPGHAADFENGASMFAKQAEATLAHGTESLAGLPARAIFTYHRSWTYFAAAFGLEVAATIEPIPGIPPTAHHLQDLVGIARERKIPVAITEPYFSGEAGEFLARETGLRIVRESSACDDASAGSWAAHLERVCAAVAGSAPAPAR
jgi:ABC-type Zn uptake system ZnuABC Zn-binding protein ZnuA